MYTKEKDQNNRHDRRDDRRGGRPRFHSDRRENHEESAEENEKILPLINEARKKMLNSIEPVSYSKLNAFERKLIHRHFDNDPNFVTKTYRNGEDFDLFIYPVGNLKKYAEEKAAEALQTKKTVVLPHMSNYERFIIHDALKENDSIKTESKGEDEERHIEIAPEAFGRGLRRIIKKIRLM